MFGYTGTQHVSKCKLTLTALLFTYIQYNKDRAAIEHLNTSETIRGFA